MLSSTLILIFLSLCIGTGAWLIFLWAVKKGEFDDMEGPKYRMLDDDPVSPAAEEEDDHADDN
ncbi:cbb3-type cytochrome oxidase assembly protein CcoS [Geothermobacter hydrogeniphilus]|uniref:Cytochrome oxidase maturation protein, cbb3-type n=1 Tax=Geothermobacter hydrogeniphilus TaxID=1969733 RepID=A0A1X0YD15_9BACT|nr:cbb3-type cytochrome oxidase assembly protein CcoS [Geothermobacter hydrogeniphilus]ORJ62864.1 cytochrome oxidase maturation protein, cbb3-type [Geothermobacter hydrogeniphilus]